MFASSTSSPKFSVCKILGCLQTKTTASTNQVPWFNGVFWAYLGGRPVPEVFARVLSPEPAAPNTLFLVLCCLFRGPAGLPDIRADLGPLAGKVPNSDLKTPTQKAPNSNQNPPT